MSNRQCQEDDVPYISNQLGLFVHVSGIYYVPPAAEGHGRRLCNAFHTCISASVRACFHLSRFYLNLNNISFIYKDIFTNLAGKVYACYENLSVHNFGLIFKNKMAAITNCLKNIKVH